MMLGLTGETFSDAMLERAQLRDQFFVRDGASMPHLADIMAKHTASLTRRLHRKTPSGSRSSHIRASHRQL